MCYYKSSFLHFIMITGKLPSPFSLFWWQSWLIELTFREKILLILSFFLFHKICKQSSIRCCPHLASYANVWEPELAMSAVDKQMPFSISQLRLTAPWGGWVSGWLWETPSGCCSSNLWGRKREISLCSFFCSAPWCVNAKVLKNSAELCWINYFSHQ